MQPSPTVPAWVSWYRRARARDALRPDAHARPRNRIAVYTFGRDDPTTLIRLNSMLGSKRGGAGVVGVTPPNDPWREPYPLDDGWQVPVMPVGIKRHYQYEPISIVLPARPGTLPPSAGEAGAGAGAGGWGGAARGWAAGTALLALLVLLVRSAEKCLDKKLFQLRRRQSEEWPTANVVATSHRNQTTMHGQRDPELPSDLPIEATIDLPPPYSECANTGPNTGPNVANKPHIIEEPPPPYSACYVTYSNPKDGIPSVHFYNRRRPDEPGSSQDVTDHRSDPELVFDNGRILEREGSKDTSDVPSDVTDTSNTSNNSAENTPPDRVILA